MISLSNVSLVASSALTKATKSNVTIDDQDASLISLNTSCSILGSVSPIWASTINASVTENIKSVALDSSNAIYVSGEYSGSVDTYSINSCNMTAYKIPIGTSTSGANLVKYNSAGNVQWVAAVDGVGLDTANSLTVSGSNVYMVGTYSNGTPTIYNSSGTGVVASTAGLYKNLNGAGSGFAVKYNQNGQLEWGASIAGRGNVNATSCVVDSTCNVYMAGKYSFSAPTVYRGSAYNNIDRVVSTLTGDGNADYLDTADGVSRSSWFNSINSACIDSKGKNLYVCDRENHKIRRINIETGITTTIAGAGITSGGTSGATDGTGTSAFFSRPRDICIDVNDTYLYVSDTGNNIIRRVVIATSQVTTVATGFNTPRGICIDAANTSLYVADQGNHVIKKYNLSNQTTSNIVGILGSSGAADATGTNALFTSPIGICIDSGDYNLYVTGNGTIRRINTINYVVTTIAGSNSALTYLDSTGTNARFPGVLGVCIDSPNANLYVTDHHAVRRVALASSVVTTIAGTSASGSTDGTGTIARFSSPSSICIDPLNLNLYISDPVNHRLKRMSLAVNEVKHIAGNPSAVGYCDTMQISGIWGPYGITRDHLDNVYAGETGQSHSIKKIDTNGVITTIVGNGISGNRQGLGTTARVTNVMGMCVDSIAKYLYFVDDWSIVKRVDLATNEVINFAGSGGYGYVNGPGATAQFMVPKDLCIDSKDEYLYVADMNSHSIRRIHIASRVVSGFASGGFGNSDGSSSSARLALPHAICIDSTDTNLYFADSHNHKIRKCTIATGDIVTVAGGGNTTTVLNLVGTNASFKFPKGICIDLTNTTLYVGDTENNLIRRITLADGQVTTFIGSGSFGSANGTGTAASMIYPFKLCFDTSGTKIFACIGGNDSVKAIDVASASMGNYAGQTLFRSLNTKLTGIFNKPNFSCVDSTNTYMYVTDTDNLRVRRIHIESGTVVPFAGNGNSTHLDGIGAAAQFTYSRGICIDSTNTNLYVGDSESGRLRKITVGTANVVTIGTYGVTNFKVRQMCIDSTNTFIYAADIENHVIRKIQISDGAIVTIAGSFGISGNTDGTGAVARFRQCAGVCIDSTNTNLYVTDLNHRVRRIVIATGAVTSLAGPLNGATGLIDATGTNARFASPFGLCIDQTDTNLYVCDSYNHSIRKIVIATGAVSTFAGRIDGGIGLADYSGTDAFFNVPNGIVMSPDYKSLYVTEWTNACIRKIELATAAVSTIAGIYAPSFTTITFQRIIQPSLNVAFMGIFDKNGNIYISNTNNHVIRKLDRNGIVTTVAGSGVATHTNSVLNHKGTVYFTISCRIDSLGNLYLAHQYGIRKVDVNGLITNLVGGRTFGYMDGAGAKAMFNGLREMCVDSTNTYMYGSDTGNNRIRRITLATGYVTTIAGSTLTTDTIGTGTNAFFSSPRDLCIDSTNTYLYICDQGHHRIRRLTIATGEVIQFAGTGVTGGTDAAIGTNASLNFPTGICIDSTNSNLYVSEGNRIRRIVISTTTVSTLAGSPLGATGALDATGTNATFSELRSPCIDPTNTNLYVAELNNARIRRIVISTGVVTTFAGWTNADLGYLDATGTNARFATLTGMSIDASGSNLYASDANNATIRRIVISTQVVSTYVGTIGANRITNNAYYPGSLNSPEGICFDSVCSNIYITDKNNLRIKKLDMSSGLMTTLAGSGITGNTDALGEAASFTNIRSVCLDPTDQNLFLTDWLSFRVRRIALSNNNVVTLAGSGNSGNTDGLGLSASFGRPIGICIDPVGSNLYFCDNQYNRVKRITLSNAQVTTIAGNNTAATVNGLGAIASFNSPHGICFDAVNNAMYVVHYNDGAIRYVTTGGNVTTLTGTTNTYADGIGTSAGFSNPYSVTISDDSTQLLVTDRDSYLRLIQNVSSPIAGSVTLPTPSNISSEPSYVIKYNSTGLPTYAINVHGTSANTSLTTMAVDSSDNWYIAGNYTGTPTLSTTTTSPITLGVPLRSNATYLAEYNSAGVPQFASRIDGTLSTGNVSLKVDSQGCIFLSGQYDTTGNPPIIYNASGAASSITLPTLSTSSTPASFVVKYSSVGVAEWASALYGVSINKISLNRSSDVVAIGSYITNATLYNPDASISSLNEPAALNSTSTGIIVEYASTGYPIDVKVVDSTGGVQLTDSIIDSQGQTIAVGNYTNSPSIYNNKGVVTVQTLPDNSGSVVIEYGKVAKATYNLPTTMTPDDNGFVKYIKNDGTTSITINVIRSAAQPVTVASHTITAGSTASFVWNNQWHRMT